MRQKYFITGTDTDVGKTLVSAALLHRFARDNYTTLGMKPIAAGCVRTDEGLRNEDAVLLQQYSTSRPPAESTGFPRTCLVSLVEYYLFRGIGTRTGH